MLSGESRCATKYVTALPKIELKSVGLGCTVLTGIPYSGAEPYVDLLRPFFAIAAPPSFAYARFRLVASIRSARADGCLSALSIGDRAG
ncbi:hypothetical protein D3C71_1570880 [compost metagenome]